MFYRVKEPAGQSPDRSEYLCCGNYGTYDAPEWGRMGTGVKTSAANMNWSLESGQDILGNTRVTMKKPIIEQEFDPCDIDSGDKYQKKLLNLAVVEQDAQALCNQDLLRVHLYLVDESGDCFAERFPSSSVEATSIGGDGGGPLTMPIKVTFGGKREKGTINVADDGTITFIPREGAGT